MRNYNYIKVCEYVLKTSSDRADLHMKADAFIEGVVFAYNNNDISKVMYRFLKRRIWALVDSIERSYYGVNVCGRFVF